MTGRDPELMMIGDFASSVGLTASALRFYADSGVLEPAEIDPVSGYRLYSADQHDTAVLLRRLRDLDLPLPDVRRVLSASPGTAARIIEEHVSSLIDTTAEIRRTAEELITGFPTAPSTDFLATFRGFSLAEALDQVLTATVREPGIPVLSSVQMCVGPGFREHSAPASRRPRPPSATRRIRADHRRARNRGGDPGNRANSRCDRRRGPPSARRKRRITRTSGWGGGQRHPRRRIPLPGHRLPASRDAFRRLRRRQRHHRRHPARRPGRSACGGGVRRLHRRRPGHTGGGDRQPAVGGGQRQRVALARALASDAPVLVLHDPTTAVDSVTEAVIADRLRDARRGLSTILLTSSPTLLAACDTVVDLTDGDGTEAGR